MTLAWRAPLIPIPRPAVELKPREADVLWGLHHGWSNEEIADRLFLSVWTVKSHLKTLYRALGARDRAHAVSLTVPGRVAVTVKESW